MNASAHTGNWGRGKKKENKKKKKRKEYLFAEGGEQVPFLKFSPGLVAGISQIL